MISDNLLCRQGKGWLWCPISKICVWNSLETQIIWSLTMTCLVMLGKLLPLLVCGLLTHLANDSFKCLSGTGEACGTKAGYHIYLLVLKCSAL